MSIAYDPLGRLKQTTASSSTEQYLYDGDSLVVEYDNSGNILRRYVPGQGADETLVWYEGSGLSSPHWLHTDQQGSVVAATDGSANATTYAYSASGEPGSWGSSPPTPIFRYTGQAALSAANLYYYKARIYDPRLGRFLQTDPVGYSAGMNLYAYAGNDPANGSDPSGLDPCNPSYVANNGPGIPGAETVTVTGICQHQNGGVLSGAGGALAHSREVNEPDIPYSGPTAGAQAGPTVPTTLRGGNGTNSPSHDKCVKDALLNLAVSAGVDAIGLIPVAGGEGKVVARYIGNQVGYRGIVADRYGAGILRSVDAFQKSTGAGAVATGFTKEDYASAGLAAAGLVPVLGQAVAGISIGIDIYRAARAINACPP